jgi:hypothetical protein
MPADGKVTFPVGRNRAAKCGGKKRMRLDCPHYNTNQCCCQVLMYHRRDFVHKVIRDAPIGHPRCVSWRQEGSSSGKKTVQGSQATTSQKVARHDEAEEVGSSRKSPERKPPHSPAGGALSIPQEGARLGLPPCASVSRSSLYASLGRLRLTKADPTPKWADRRLPIQLFSEDRG